MSSWPPRWLTPVAKESLESRRAAQVIAFIEAYGLQTKDTIAGKSGSQLQLRDWQIELIKHLFAEDANGRLLARTALVGMPRKNGKSALGSSLALWSLFLGANGGEVYSCAADKEQARIVFGDAKRMIEAHTELSELVRIYRDAIEVVDSGSIYRVLSSEAYTKEGLSPTFVVFDELHATPNPDLYNVMQLGMGAREEPMLLSITTAGVKTDNSGKDSTAYAQYQYGQKVARGEQPDPSFFMAWWEALPEADHRNPETWEMANPGYGDLNSIEDFEAMARRIEEPEFRTKRCNQWVSSANAWLPSGLWETLETKRELDPDAEYILGFDGSFNNDCTVIVGCQIPRDEDEKPYLFLVKAWEKQPQDTDDWRVDTLDVESTIMNFIQNHPKTLEVACDPFRWQRTMAVLQDTGINIVEWPTTSVRRMVPACQKFYTQVTENRLEHDGDPFMTRHLSNAAVKTDNYGPRIVKEHRSSSKKIDAAVAAIIALDRALVIRETEAPRIPQFFI
jgi:phage terminase large subunit-like protein